MRVANPLPRRVEPEILDALPAGDARAVRSRRDLRRINRATGARTILCRAIDKAMLGRAPRRIVEIGAGDGTLLLRIARARSGAWKSVEATIVDRQDVVASATREAFAQLGWTLRVVVRDVFDWLSDAPRHDLALANLFLHHFAGDALPRLIEGVAARTDAFVACEPRRSPAALMASRMVGWLGCNDVTRNDAVVSVHAGFRDAELTKLWPDARRWQIEEYAAGLFTHCFAASRRSGNADDDR